MIGAEDSLTIIAKHLRGLSQLLAGMSASDYALEEDAAYLLSDAALELAKAIEQRAEKEE